MESSKKIPYISYLWPLAGLVFIYFIIDALQLILLPFALGFVSAYILFPLVKKFDANTRKRKYFSLLLMLGFGLTQMILMILVFPLLLSQLLTFVTSLKPLIEDFLDFAFQINIIKDLFDQGDIQGKVISFIPSIGKKIAVFATYVLSHISSFFTILIYIVLAPYVGYAILVNWEKIHDFLYDLVPMRFRDDAQIIFTQINVITSSYIRGVSLLCLTLAIFYMVALWFISLPHGIIIGLLSGLLSFIPFIGTILGLLLATFSSFAHYNIHGAESIFLYVAGIYICANVLDTVLLNPYLVANRVGLNDVWMLFALLAGGTLFGFLGILLAFPLFAAIGVILSFILKKYKASNYYNT